ncbi:Ig-like domain-containing protein [Nonomuraea sp. NPDC005501]|uniref:Ig-like domain-containing protein n=1 Tax=Nonomuraea sp. NPDC005501 TaxID=3156884 RepID=UPI0033AEABE4
MLANNAATVGSGAAVTGRVFALTNNVTLQGTTSGPHTRASLPDALPSQTTLTVSPSGSSIEGQQVTLSATVSVEPPLVDPQGEVAFKDGTTLLGTDSIDENGGAQLQTSALSGGNHRLTAVFLDGQAFDSEALVTLAPSTSPGVNHVVTNTLWPSSATPAVPTIPTTTRSRWASGLNHPHPV